MDGKDQKAVQGLAIEEELMTKRRRLIFLILPVFLLGLLGLLWLPGATVGIAAQQNNVFIQRQSDIVIRREVRLVQLNVAITDGKTQYITDLRPSDFIITEDDIQQEIATFEEGIETTLGVTDIAPDESGSGLSGSVSGSALDPGSAAGSLPREPVRSNALGGASVFILFDTSNYMYRDHGFVFAQDAIADFVRSLDGPNRIAFYSYNRNLSRATRLTSDRIEVQRGIRGTVNGADSALYNALLLTLRDATQVLGKKAVVVFTNGPDNSSTVSPEEVSELAQSLGIPVYMISTRQARLDRISTVVFGRMSANTGGEAYFAKNWKDEDKAFAAIRNDLAHLYYLSYYPKQNPNRGWRKITVKLTGQYAKKYTIRTRSGYRPIPQRASVNLIPAQ